MENAAKALLIAAAVIFAMLVTTLLVIFYGQISSYFEEKNKMTEIEQLQEFNARFENYHDKEIRGNELISIMNRIIDYNNLQADMQGYQPIAITIDMLGHEDELMWEIKGVGRQSGGQVIINTINGEITNQNGTDDSDIADIASLSANLWVRLGISDTKLQRLSSEIDNIVMLSKATDKEAYKKYRAKLLTRILGYSIEENDDITNIENATYRYYQYIQFKRAMFHCTDVTYDQQTGRVNGMFFDVILEVNSEGANVIKFD